MIVVGVAYAIIGAGSAALDNVVWPGGVHPWRLGAWIASAAVGAAHIGYEHYRLGSPSLRTALHAAAAVALGALGIAIAANIHWLLAEQRPPRAPLLALPLFPLITAIPAFVAALIVATVLTRFSRRVQL
jgi:hypothetical protein